MPTTSPWYLVIPLALAAAVPTAQAVERDEINDLRAYYAIPPDYDVAGGDEVDGGHRVGVQHMRQITDLTDRGGWIWGIEGAIQIVDDIEATIVNVTGLAGYAYQMQNIQSLHFEGTPFLGLGVAALEETDDDTEIYFEFGLRGAAFWTFDSNWQVGLDLRLQRQDADVIDGSGLLLAFVGGYRF